MLATAPVRDSSGGSGSKKGRLPRAMLWGAAGATLLTVALFGALTIARYAAPMQPYVPVVRSYFIAAEEVLWDYLPLGVDGLTGIAFNNTAAGSELADGARFYVLSAPNRIGTKYKKCVYQEYSDAEFLSKKPRALEWQHLGLLGPALRAEVGDVLKVAFLNRCSFPASIHPHALFYLEADEGVPMPTGAAGSMPMASGGGGGMPMADSSSSSAADDVEAMLAALDPGRGDGSSVAPGSRHVYEWLVPQRAGPGPEDSSSAMWPYHSHVDEVADVSSGLLGPIIVTRRGLATSKLDLKPRDVDREFVLSLSVVDENLSHYLEDSMAQSGVAPGMLSDADFQASNLKHAINGYLCSNLPGLEMAANESVRWHVFAFGDEVDLHGAHWHGQTVVLRGRRCAFGSSLSFYSFILLRTDDIDLIPASVKTADMTPDNTGRWMLHCHSSRHIKAGMAAYYDVVPCLQGCPAVAGSALRISLAPVLLLLLGAAILA